ncbi:serine/threonine-protein phosphatase [Streptomyces sp. NBC_01728]|uniref:PP2C family protein-serine/threonine phosphatase n=1 Tax=unclassified Streptomyces TaxID=2593676 RepID=UPI0022526A81|nr:MULTISPECIES: PP2C family protein-serine/threonine phosphatase [unclassified Streptomyces]MCX4458610.1 serine/threonine-protein phosphatase [Streptomyces sp. NBC_01719]MCX4497967.1 serine/threonine-protein phosphatase [Streptomyces sp. NBC_01728]
MADERAWLGELLASVESAPPEMAVSVLAQLLATKLAATEVSFLITDHGGKAVVRLTGAAAEGGPENPRPIQLRGSDYEQVVRSQQVHVTSGEREGKGEPGPIQVIAPVSDRGDAIGLLELTVPVRPDRQTVRLIVEATHVLAYVVITNRRFTDLYEWGRRTTRLSLAAEIQHRLLPDSFTCETGRFIVAGALEPAADIGGDTFDYTLNRHALHLSLTDAMGHDVQAALVATMVVGALRNARRAGGGLLDQAQDAHQAVADYSDRAHQAFAEQPERVREAVIRHGAQVMATGQLLRVSLDTGQTTFVNAGHVCPLRLRDGQVEEITPLVDLPFGVTPNPGYRLQSLDLRQGDRLILFTDGMLEPHGTEADLSDLIQQTSDWHPRDAVRLFTETVLELSNQDPRDDATVLCLDWPAPNSPYTGHR